MLPFNAIRVLRISLVGEDEELRTGYSSTVTALMSPLSKPERGGLVV